MEEREWKRGREQEGDWERDVDEEEGLRWRERVGDWEEVGIWKDREGDGCICGEGGTWMERS